MRVMSGNRNEQVGWGRETYFTTRKIAHELRDLAILEWCDLCHEWHPCELDGSRIENWERVKQRLNA